MVRQSISKFNFLFVLLVALLIIVFQSTVLDSLFKTFSPDIVLILIIYISFHRFLLEGACLTLALGWFIEAYSGAPHGVLMTTYLWIFLISKMVGSAVFLTRVSGTLFVVFIMGFLQTIFIWGFMSVFFQATPSLEANIRVWIPNLILQLLSTPLMFRIFSSIDKLFEKESPTKITGVLGAPIFTH